MNQAQTPFDFLIAERSILGVLGGAGRWTDLTESDGGRIEPTPKRQNRISFERYRDKSDTHKSFIAQVLNYIVS